MTAMRTLALALAAASARAGPCTVGDDGYVVEEPEGTPPQCLFEYWLTGGEAHYLAGECATADNMDSCESILMPDNDPTGYAGYRACYYDFGEPPCTISDGIMQGDLVIERVDGLITLDLSAQAQPVQFTEIDGHLMIRENAALSEIILGAMVVHGEIEIAALPALVHIDWPDFTAHAGTMQVRYMSALETITLTNLASLGSECADCGDQTFEGHLEIEDCPALLSFSAPNLNLEFNNLRFRDTPHLLDFDGDCGADCAVDQGGCRLRHHDLCNDYELADCTAEAFNSLCDNSCDLLSWESAEAWCTSISDENQCYEAWDHHFCDFYRPQAVCPAPPQAHSCAATWASGSAAFQWTPPREPDGCSPETPTLNDFHHPSLYGGEDGATDLQWTAVEYAADGTLAAVAASANSAGVLPGTYWKQPIYFACNCRDGRSWWIHETHASHELKFMDDGYKIEDAGVRFTSDEFQCDSGDAEPATPPPTPPPTPPSGGEGVICPFGLLMEAVEASINGTLSDLASDPTVAACRSVADQLRAVDIVSSCPGNGGSGGP